MNILVVLAHPDPHSFNHAIAGRVLRTLKSNGHKPVFHDLYAEGFEPGLTQREVLQSSVPFGIRQHCRELANADGIVIVHPNWWGQPPAMLKGYVDRVFRAGVAYRFDEGDGGEGVPVGLLKAKAAMVFNTANTPAEREAKVFGDPLEMLWKTCIFGLCGVKRFHRRTFSVIVTSTLRQRRQWLGQVEKSVSKYFPPARATG